MIFKNIQQYNAYRDKFAEEYDMIKYKNVINQNYIFERLLERISVSQYKENFILKGGLLLSSIFGLQGRSTMDMDTSLKNIKLDIDNVTKMFNEIMLIDLMDNVTFEIIKTTTIMENMSYEGIRIFINSYFGKTITKIHIDVATGDVITPKEIIYSYPKLFDGEVIEILSYPIETILAEKYETILKLSVTSSRAKDFYDIYALLTLKDNFINKLTLKQAIYNTFKNRNSLMLLEKESCNEIIENIQNSRFILKSWENYQKQFTYAESITFAEVIEKIIFLKTLYQNN